MKQTYRYCGVPFVSELPLPELPAAAAGTSAERAVRFGATPTRLPDEQHRTATFAHNGREALWWLAGIGRFHVSDHGRLITLSPDDGAEEAALRLMLLHPVWALASLLRGEWLLNAAAVSRQGELTAFIGPSACGKSTLAALLLREGYGLVSDALLRITQDAQGRLIGHPQGTWLQLWPSALKHLELDDNSTELRAGLPLRRVTLPTQAEALPIARLALLREQRDNTLDILTQRPQQGTLGFTTLLQCSAGNTWQDDLADRHALFQHAVGLLKQARIERLDLPWGLAHRERMVSEVQQWLDPAAIGAGITQSSMKRW